MEITACPNCGSKRIYQGTMGDGVLTGYTYRDVCRDCGYQGAPIIFDSEVEYKKFLENIPKKETEIKPEGIKEKSLRRKLPAGIIILSIIMILQAVLSIYLYYTLGGSRIPIWLWVYYITIFVISAIILPYGLIKGKVWAWTLGGILFALSIPVGLIFLYYITRPQVRAYFGKT